MTAAESVKAAGEEVEAAVEELAPWIVRLARIGFAAKAAIYTVVGILAISYAYGLRKRAPGTTDALASLVDKPFGRAALMLLAIGLFGYAIWRLVEAVMDPDDRGHGLKGIALRISFAFRGIVHGFIGVQAVRIIFKGPLKPERQMERWTSELMSAPFGALLVAIVGASVAGFGIYQVYKGFAAKLTKKLDVSGLSGGRKNWAIYLSRFGVSARGIVFAVIGGFLIRAAQTHDPGRTVDFQQSLTFIASQPAGTWMLTGIGIGLISFGLYQAVQAAFRNIHVSDRRAVSRREPGILG